jgi:hypothetical protein
MNAPGSSSQISGNGAAGACSDHRHAFGAVLVACRRSLQAFHDGVQHARPFRGVEVLVLLLPDPVQHCAACHGTNGDGNGPASVWLYPKPRDFSAGQFKIKSTPASRCRRTRTCCNR